MNMPMNLVMLFVMSAAIGIHCEFPCSPYDTVQGEGAHTMCLYPPNSGCPKLSTNVTEKDIKDVIRVHNTYRQKVANGQQENQPGATNMKELKWNDELATIAQRLVDQCKMEHDKNRNTKTYKWVGQNLYKYYSTAPLGFEANFTRAIEAWYDEVSMFPSKDISPFVFSKPTGHYTAVVWADTIEVGCGYAYFNDAETGYTQLYGCNYAPGGNEINGTMYKTGTAACADCPNSCSTDYPGLCK